MAFFVYLLRSELTGRHYIGQTSDLTARFTAHNAGRVRTTKKGRPWTLVGCETYETRSGARWRERQLKLHSGTRLSFIKRLGEPERR